MSFLEIYNHSFITEPQSLTLLVVEVGFFLACFSFFVLFLFISPIMAATRFTSMFGLLVSICFLSFILFNTLNFELVGGSVYFSSLNQVIKALSFLVVFFICLVSLNFSTSTFTFEYVMLILFSHSAGLFILSFDHLPLLFILIEIQALIGYTLVVYRRKSQPATESGMKYFLLGSISSAVLVFGIAVLYGSVGSFSFLEISAAQDFDISYNLRMLGSLCVVFGFMFKLSAAPLHYWTPEVYENVEFLTLAYFSTLPKFSILALLTGQASFLVDCFKELFFAAGFLSLAVGSISGLFQDSIKKIFAYSTIVNTGYILVLLASTANLAFLDINLSFLAVWLQMLAYSLAIVSLSGFLQSFANGSEFDSLLALTYTSIRSRICFLVLLVSLSGIPPTFGFFAKFLLLYSVSNPILVSILMIASVLTLVFYMRIAGTAFFYTRDHEFFSSVETNFSEKNSFFSLCFFPVSFLNVGLLILPWFTLVNLSIFHN